MHQKCPPISHLVTVRHANISGLLPPVYIVRGKVLFSQVSVCSHLQGGYPLPRSRQGGGYPLPRSRWEEGAPSQVLVGGTPYRGPGRGYVPPSQVGEGVSPSQVGEGGEGGGTPSQVGYPLQNSIACTCYVAGCMPLAFTQEDFLVVFSILDNDKTG